MTKLFDHFNVQSSFLSSHKLVLKAYKARLYEEVLTYPHCFAAVA
ncbi:hypothetical protein DB41_KU00090 [Neochlamydia sp. TUME1]|nr:hypothetical protein DB41_KU00090 [Neochlamydia sp. TUME1]